MGSLNVHLNALDLALIVVIFLGAWRGYRTGLLRAIIRVAVVVLTFIGGLVFGAPLAAWLEEQFQLHTSISSGATSALTQIMALPATAPEQAPLNPLAGVLAQLEQLKLPPAALRFLENQIEQLTQATLGGVVQNVATLLADLFATMLVNGLVFLLILIAINLVAHLFIWVLKDGLGLMNGALDSLGGFCLGLVQALLILSLLLALAVPLLATQPESPLAALLQQSVVANAILELFYAIVG